MPSRHILFCNYEFPPLGGGGSTCSWYLARELTRLGHHVEVVTAAHGRLERHVERGRFELRRLPALRRRRGQSNPLEMMSYVAVAAPWLLLRPRRPDLVVSFHSIPSGMAAFPLSRIRGVPHIVLLRGGDVPGWLPGELELYHRATLWLNRCIVYTSAQTLANSDGLRDLALKSFPRKDIGVLPNGVDLREFAPPPNGRQRQGGPVRLLFIGRITTQKGIDTLLRTLAARELAAEDWHLDIGGAGPQLADYRDLAERLGLLRRISFLGWLDRRDLRLRYDAADILVLPSRYEGMPNVVLEAAASGLPIIGTRVAGTEQLIADGRNGFLVEVDDQAALGERILRLVRSADLRREMGTESRRLAEEEWSWHARARELEAHMETILHR